jgi:ZipA, C-terminal FtsZ-binding domain
MSWWKSLFGRKASPDRAPPDDTPSAERQQISADDLYVAPQSESEDRVEQVMPGTYDLPRLLELVPPPVSPDRAPKAEAERDFAPDPIADVSMAFATPKAFGTAALKTSLTKELRQSFGSPWFHVRLPSGQVTFLDSSNPVPLATVLIAAWSLQDDDRSVESITSYSEKLARWLAERPERFTGLSLDAGALEAQWRRARAIKAVTPSDVAIVVAPRPGTLFDGRKTWDTLHRVGLHWGDMDQFQWRDPTHQTDYLFWAQVEDGRIGYALPEEIAQGEQHFTSVHFIFEIARTPAPAHVLREMIRAAAKFAEVMQGDLLLAVDETEVSDFAGLSAAVDGVVAQLAKLGVQAGSFPVCRLR